MDVAALQARIETGLRPLIGGRRVALLDIPNHRNSGDNAIYLGEEELFRRLRTKVVHRSDAWNHDLRQVRQLSAETVLCIHGGGNFGDVWPRFQALRERVLAEHRNRTIVQLPQSIHFQDEGNAVPVAKLIAEHPALHLFVREEASLEAGRRLFGLEAQLIPDMAFMLGRKRRPVPAMHDVLVVCRADKEAGTPLADRARAEGLEAVDWVHSRAATRGLRQRVLTDLQAAVPRMNRFPSKTLAGAGTRYAYERMAWLRLGYGLRVISQGRTVVTDRLHAHIMCELMGIPSVAIDTGYGKVRGVHDLWMSESSISRIALSFEEALAMARELTRSR